MRRRAIFAAAAICLGLLPFAAAECLLRQLDVGVPDSYEDPFVAFSEAFSLFDYDATAEVYRIAKHHHYFFGQQEFPATKAHDSFRAFCLGGSTVLGHPYDTPTSFPKWLELELNARRPNRKHEFINCGGMSYASYRLIPILEEVLEHDPDLIVVMTGHNEFLEDRTYGDLKSRSLIQKCIDEAAGVSRLVTLGRRLTRSSKRPRCRCQSEDRIGTCGRCTTGPCQWICLLPTRSAMVGGRCETPCPQHASHG